MVSLDNFDWFVDSKYKNKSVKAFSIILKVSDEYQFTTTYTSNRYV